MDRFFRLNQDAHIRAADADREQVAERLRAACAEGRLSPDELSARLDACLRAKTIGALRPLVADLPAPAAAVQRRRSGRALARPRGLRPAVVVLALLAGYFALKAGVWLATAFAFGLGALAFGVIFSVLPIVLVALATAWLVRRVFGPPAHRPF